MSGAPRYLPSANKAIRDGCPDKLAMAGRLFGLEPAAPERCRVLEIGCAEGVHLAALAALAPESRYLGIDLDARAIAKGRETVGLLGLSNLTLECGDFAELAGREERFDYVVAHGMYSWVSREARNTLLSIIRGVLSENGIAYVSFNALPGSHARSMVRELLLPHVRGLSDPHERVARARDVARQLLRESTQAGTAFGSLRGELEHCSKATDSLVFHDYLAEHNECVTLTAFVEHLERHGLHYLADSGTLDRSAFAAHPLVTALEASSPSPVERLAYVDRLEMRRFRQAAICRDGERRAIDFERAASLWFASSAEPAAPGAVRGQGPVRFKTVSGLELETTMPELKLALYELGRVWPHALLLSDLAERVTEHVGSPISAEMLGRRLLDSAASAAVRAFIRPPRAVRAFGKKPKTTALARLEALRGNDVTNLHHEPVTIDVAFHRALLALLDGSCDADGLVRLLAERIEAGSLEVPGIDPSARSRWEGLLAREVEAGLERLARFALLLE